MMYLIMKKIKKNLPFQPEYHQRAPVSNGRFPMELGVTVVDRFLDCEPTTLPFKMNLSCRTSLPWTSAYKDAYTVRGCLKEGISYFPSNDFVIAFFSTIQHYMITHLPFVLTFSVKMKSQSNRSTPVLLLI